MRFFPTISALRRIYHVSAAIRRADVVLNSCANDAPTEAKLRSLSKLMKNRHGSRTHMTQTCFGRVAREH